MRFVMRKLASIALCTLIALPSLAKEREGVNAASVIEVGGKKLVLMGMGLRKKLWFKVYMASLYAEDPIADGAKFIASDQIKRVEMHMLRDLERGKIIEAVQQGFENNAGPDMPRLKDRLDQFIKAIPDLKEKQTIVITWFPGRGTFLKAGSGEEIGIEGKDFADALFSVWLGKHPVDDELRNEMLTNR
jgi:hypothetical protein